MAGATGLNVVADPVRLPRRKDGTSDLQVAVNVSIDESLRVKSRKGVSELQSGNFHSLFSDKGDCFVVKDTALYQVAEDGTLQGIRSELTDAKMDFAQVGDRTYYTNGYEKGYILGGTSYSWSKGTYTGPTSTRHFVGPPVGTHLAEFNGRMFIGQENVLWWSEPFNFGLYNRAESFAQFYTNIRMIKPVAGGIFVSTEKNTWFLEGQLPLQFRTYTVLNYPAIEWTDSIQYISSGDLGVEVSGLCAVWAGEEGVILGLPTGQVINLNKDKVIYPETARSGFGELMGFNYIHGVE